MKPVLFVALAAFVGLLACEREPHTESALRSMIQADVTLSDVDSSAWEDLADRRIFFGHQSVGRNILSGVRQLLDENPEIPVRLRIVQSDVPTDVEGPALIEANIGENGRPESKAAAFADAMDSGFGAEQGALAMYKYCYVDVTEATDPEELFEDYEARVEGLKQRYPTLTVVHFTLPLQTAHTGLKEHVKHFIGRATKTSLNLTRMRYNRLLRDRYLGEDPIFDLAYLESVRPDGSRAYSSHLGRKVPMLAEEWSDDGGHLNEAGQKQIAERFLVFLAQLGED